MAADVRWLGHASFHLSGGGADVLIDPWLTGNPKAAAQADELPADVMRLLARTESGDKLNDQELVDAFLIASGVYDGRQRKAYAKKIDDITAASLHDGLMALVPYELQREIGKLAPTHFEAPTGQRHPIRYDGDEPVLAIRVQELFGLKQHPAVAGGRLPLLLELVSPAHRPIQTTRDLPGFWAGSWRDVRADMRGRYPKHPWPEDPAEAMPTTRAKPRGT